MQTDHHAHIVAGLSSLVSLIVGAGTIGGFLGPKIARLRKRLHIFESETPRTEAVAQQTAEHLANHPPFIASFQYPSQGVSGTLSYSDHNNLGASPITKKENFMNITIEQILELLASNGDAESAIQQYINQQDIMPAVNLVHAQMPTLSAAALTVAVSGYLRHSWRAHLGFVVDILWNLTPFTDVLNVLIAADAATVLLAAPTTITLSNNVGSTS